MRCSTPIMRVLRNGAEITWPAAFSPKKGNQYIRKPSKKINTVRLKIFIRNAESLISLYLCKEKLIAFPTANKNEGKTRSVGVKPCQLACSSGGYGTAPLPGVFTMIIKQMVIPLKTSNAKNRSFSKLIIKNYFLKDQITIDLLLPFVALTTFSLIRYQSVICELITDLPSGVNITIPFLCCKTLSESW